MRNQKFNIIFLLLFSFLLSPCVKSYAQSEPTIDETAEWIRSKLITHAGLNDVNIDVSNCTISFRPSYDYSCKVTLSNLNANAFNWSGNTLEIPAAGNKYAVIEEYTKKDGEKGTQFNQVVKFRFFDMDKDNMKERFTKAMKLLIKQCGGYTKEEKF
jgi:hypothetical protein